MCHPTPLGDAPQTNPGPPPSHRALARDDPTGSIREFNEDVLYLAHSVATTDEVIRPPGAREGDFIARIDAEIEKVNRWTAKIHMELETLVRGLPPCAPVPRSLRASLISARRALRLARGVRARARDARPPPRCGAGREDLQGAQQLGAVWTPKDGAGGHGARGG